MPLNNSCNDPTTDTSALESEIDMLVYRLYGLSDKEIAQIENHDKHKAIKPEVRTRIRWL